MTWLTRVLGGALQALGHTRRSPGRPSRATRLSTAYRRGAEVTTGDLTITVKVTSTTVYELWVHRGGRLVGSASVARIDLGLRFPNAAWVADLLVADLRRPRPPVDELTELVCRTIKMIDGP